MKDTEIEIGLEETLLIVGLQLTLWPVIGVLAFPVTILLVWGLILEAAADG